MFRKNILIVFGLLFLVFIIFSQKINFTSLDLGRHLENGKIVWQNPSVLFTNFYSYTETNYPFVNHHWLSGLVFYGLYLLGGFKLLSVFNILLALIIFSLAFNFARKKSDFYLSSVLSLPVIFLLSERVGIRPEAFSYLFIILTWVIIDGVAINKKYRRLLWLLPIFIIWVNLHIYFFVGLALIGFKAAAEFLPVFFKKTVNLKTRFLMAWQNAWPWIKTFILTALVCFLNPNTWRGFLYPFNILRNYGYEIVENKTIFYLGHLIINYNFLIFKFLLVLLIFTWGLDWWLSKRLRLFETFLMVFFSALGIFASRNIALFGLVSLILISSNLLSLKNFLSQKQAIIKLINNWPIKLYLLIFLSLAIIISGLCFAVNFFTQQNFIKNSLGWGLNNDSFASVNFFKEHKLSGPIFNNYDLGSALIFWLYPQEKVFVDNRPEAYSVSFFNDIYKPMQTDPTVWKTISNKYKFKTVYFSYTDSTPWAQQFMRFILNSNDWALVYFDRYTVILVNKDNTDLNLINDLSLNSFAFREHLNSLLVNANLKEKFNLASLAEEAGQPDLAQLIYQNILFDYPNQRQALVALGSLYSNSESQVDLQAALTYFIRAQQAGYNLPGIYNQIALVYWHLSDYKKAEINWYSALSLDKNNIDALYYLDQIKSLRSDGKLPLAN